MPESYFYKGRRVSGELVRGKLKAENQRAVVNLLRARKIFVVEIKTAPVSRFSLADFFRRKIKLKDMAPFCRQFATMQEAGLPLIKCLDVLGQQSESKGLRRVIEEVEDGVKRGQNLSEAFKSQGDVVPEIFINMIAAGEVSGTLDQALHRLALHFEKEYTLREKIKSAMTYPLFIGGVALTAIIILMIFVVPVFTDIFTQTGASLPLPTLILIGASTFIAKYWYLLLPGLVVLAFILRYLIGTRPGKEFTDRLKLRLPVIGGLTHKTLTSRFTRTLSTLLKSGVPLIQSLQTVERVMDNTLGEKEIRELEKNIKEGGRIAPLLFKSKIFPPLVVNMVAVGEESGMLDELLEKTAVFYDQEIEAMVARLSSLMEPFLILVTGIIVGFIALSIYLPLFEMAGAIQGGTGIP
ncbi:MAG TPA: type II secretion system F family protein [Desulfotomaculum sp.]|nr:type II secretion system F family protein [Desulfotomaculum sp.]